MVQRCIQNHQQSKLCLGSQHGHDDDGAAAAADGAAVAGVVCERTVAIVHILKAGAVVRPGGRAFNTGELKLRLIGLLTNEH